MGGGARVERGLLEGASRSLPARDLFVSMPGAVRQGDHGGQGEHELSHNSSPYRAPEKLREECARRGARRSCAPVMRVTSGSSGPLAHEGALLVAFRGVGEPV